HKPVSVQPLPVAGTDGFQYTEVFFRRAVVLPRVGLPVVRYIFEFSQGRIILDKGIQKAMRASHIIALVHTRVGKKPVKATGHGASGLILWVGTNGIAVTTDGHLEIPRTRIADNDAIV